MSGASVPTRSPRNVWSDPLVLVLGFGVLAMYGPLAPELVSDWNRSGNYSHGWAVLPLAVALVFARRERLTATARQPAATGAWIVAAAVAVYLLGAAASEFFLLRSSIVPWALGCVALLHGWRRARVVAFPVAFLLFMIPPPTLVWNAIALPLQLLASRVAEWTLVLAGATIERDGNVIHLAGVSLEVAAACSGLRSLVTLLALAALLAEGSLTGTIVRRFPNRVILFLAAVPIAVLLNAVRVSATALAAARVGEAAATGWVHEAAGAVSFLFALATLWFVGKGLARWERPARS
ncbi:MAG: exosortase/archaeosortase family protein [bacterium]